MSDYAAIGLTGGIASGKSTVAELFRSWGAFVADADEISRHALDKGTRCYEQTVKAFGRQILLADECVDRKKVASIVFSDPKARDLLNGIVHPYVHEVILSESEKAYCKGSYRLIVWDVPLLFETGYDAEVEDSRSHCTSKPAYTAHRGEGWIHQGGGPSTDTSADAGSGKSQTGGFGHPQQRLPGGADNKSEGSVR